MSYFKHTCGRISFDSETSIPLDVFLDLEPDYRLPDGSNGRVYVPNKKHYVSFVDGSSRYLRGKDWLQWEEGNLYISRKDQYKAYYQQVQEL